MIPRLILACGFAAVGAVGLFPPLHMPSRFASRRGCLLSDNLNVVQQRLSDNQFEIVHTEVDLTRLGLELIAIMGVAGSCTAVASAIQLARSAHSAPARAADVREPA